MTDNSKTPVDYSASLYLPKTDFPMRAGLPQQEPRILARWEEMGLTQKLREVAAGRPKFVLHDGPPYANGNIHIGHSLNKILKDLVARSQRMLGKDCAYVPGWDCHGLPIEWKIEEENYRAKGLKKPDFSDPAAMIAFRRECRAYAEKWLAVQREEFKRLGVSGDWERPYSTMSFEAEARIAAEIMKFAANGLLYRGSKPVMWSVVEKTALAEAEVEYEDHVSDTVFVKFPILKADPFTAWDAHQNEWDLRTAFIVIWTTTPWTLPGNRAISYSRNVLYDAYEVTEAPEGNWLKVGEKVILARKLVEEVFKQAKVTKWRKLDTIGRGYFQKMECLHPLFETPGYDFSIPLLDGDHVTDDTGTGFVHTAPGHGREDFDIWMTNSRQLRERGIDTRIPYTVDEDSVFTDEAPGFEGKRVFTDKGDKGDANEAVIAALIESGNLVARGRLKHQYPHSWRSKKPVLYRNTPQWFIAMDKPLDDLPTFLPGDYAARRANAGGEAYFSRTTLRSLALAEIARTQWTPPAGQNRITGMIAGRPDWVVSRQRAWGVPIALFVRKSDGEILKNEGVNDRIIEAFQKEGADAWFDENAKARFLGPLIGDGYSPEDLKTAEYLELIDDYEKISDVLDVWFDSGCTHAFVLEDPKAFPTLAGIHRKRDGGADEIMYLEGSDQHRGWFHSSLLESCGTRHRAPYDAVLTHGFTLDEKGRKMSKSLGNTVAPQKVIADAGADILRLWVGSVDYADDQRIGPEILKSVTDIYRKLRNTLRWMLGTLAHHAPGDDDLVHAPELERLMLHRLVELDEAVRAAYAAYDYKKVVALLTPFMISDLSAFYFDIRKDALYCDPPTSEKRKVALAAIEHIFRCVATWLAPILVFTTEEAWLSRYPDAASVHLEVFPDVPSHWRDEALAKKWADIRAIRAVVTGALELARAEKRIGSSLEAAPVVHIADGKLRAALDGIDFAEICITSDIRIETESEVPSEAFRLPDVKNVAVSFAPASGVKCQRSWRYFDPATADPDYPDVTPRDAQALKELGSWERAQS
ncbi:MAG: isoleucine--tRNA ligase [Methylocystis sp.]